MPYKLKPNIADFEVVDGPFEGRKFFGGKIYDEIPPEEADKFEIVTVEDTPQVTSRRSPATSKNESAPAPKEE